MKEIHKNLPVQKFTDSSYVTKSKYCLETGLIATEHCEKTADGWYKKSFMPQTCTKHVSVEIPATDDETDDTENGETDGTTNTETDDTNE